MTKTFAVVSRSLRLLLVLLGLTAAGCPGQMSSGERPDGQASAGDGHWLDGPATELGAHGDGPAAKGDGPGKSHDGPVTPPDGPKPPPDGPTAKPDAPRPDKAVVKCGNGKCEPGETCSNCPGDCGKCTGCSPACPSGQFCLKDSQGYFCTACNSTACGQFGVGCCRWNAPKKECTNWWFSATNCGGCGVVCTGSKFCTWGKCVVKGPLKAPVKDPFLSEADNLSKCPFNPMQWWAGKGDRDITFIATTDTHATDSASGCSKNGSHTGDENIKMRLALNSANAKPHVWPSGASFWRQGKVYDHIRGVLIAGDLTDAGSDPVPAGTQLGHDCREYTAYRAAYGRCGNEGKVKFPIYEAYGNHDFPRVYGAGDPNYHPVIDYLDKITAAHRPGSSKDLYDDPTAGTGHYAWRWDDIWFVNLNLKPGDKNEVIPGSTGTRLAYPRGPLKFLAKFLAGRTNNSTRQIVILSHYGLGSSRVSNAERSDFCKLIYQAQNGKGPFSGQKLSKNYPVAAHLFGHNHHLPEYKLYTCPSPYNSIKVPRFSVGTPLYKGNQNNGKLHFTIIRLGEKRLEAVGVAAKASSPTGSWSYVFKKRLYVMNK